MKKILVPTDFSLNANKALNYAVQIAKQAKAKIIILHTCDLVGAAFANNPQLKKEYNRKVIATAKENLSLLKVSIEKTEKIPVITKLSDGLITDTILFAAEKMKPNLLVMGTLGNAATKEKLFGSKTAGVIGKTTLPVLAVPLLSEWEKPKKILFAVNNFESRVAVINPIFKLAELLKAAVHIVVFTESNAIAPVKFSTDEKNLRVYVKKLQTRYKKASILATHLKGRNFITSMEKYINENDIDIIAMITHKRGFVNSLFHRSMTKKMSYHTRIPLLALPS